MLSQDNLFYKILDLQRELRRVTNIAIELATIVRRDYSLYSKVKPRTKRWIRTQDKLERARIDANDENLRMIAQRRCALDKLTKTEKDLLGLGEEIDE
jgi:hypothetical protein